jgi:hypothetical protein
LPPRRARRAAVARGRSTQAGGRCPDRHRDLDDEHARLFAFAQRTRHDPAAIARKSVLGPAPPARRSRSALVQTLVVPQPPVLHDRCVHTACAVAGVLPTLLLRGGLHLPQPPASTGKPSPD